MRLICPSCGAQYEVDDSVIPDGGRDVQCSNCGHAWFQRSARQQEAEAEEADLRAAEIADADGAAPEDSAESAGTKGDEPPAAVDEAVAEEPAPEDTDSALDEAADAPADEEPEVAESEADEPEIEEPEIDVPVAASPAPAPAWDRPRKTLDDAVRNVLREEAERETRARAVEGTSIESQPDLGLASAIGTAATTTGVRPAAVQQDRVASLGDDESDFGDDALVSRASRRELLPDIEEINSTLRATSERGAEPASVDAPETLARRRSGFRMGFSTALIIAIVGLGLYVLAPTLVRTVPALEPALTGYVSTVDSVRMWLDVRMRSLTDSIKDPSQG